MCGKSTHATKTTDRYSLCQHTDTNIYYVAVSCWFYVARWSCVYVSRASFRLKTFCKLQPFRANSRDARRHCDLSDRYHVRPKSGEMLCSGCAVHRLAVRLFPFGITTELDPSGIRKDWRIKCSGMLRRVANVWKDRSMLISTVSLNRLWWLRNVGTYLPVDTESLLRWLETLQFRCEHLKSAGRRSTLCVLYCTVQVHSYTSFFACHVFIMFTNCASSFSNGNRLRSVLLKDMFLQTLERQCRIHLPGSRRTQTDS